MTSAHDHPAPPPLRMVLIGLGAIGATIASRWATQAGGAELAGVLVRPGRAAALPPRVPVVHDLDALRELAPCVVVEAAGQDAVRAHG